MRIIHGQGYSNDDRLKFRHLIFQNIYTAMEALITAMDILTIPYGVEGLSEEAQQLVSVNVDTVEEVHVTAVHQVLITKLWSNSGIQQCYERRREFQLSDSSK